MSESKKIFTLYLSMGSIRKLYIKNEKNLVDYQSIGIEYVDGSRKNLSQLMYSKLKKKTSRVTGEVIEVDPNSYNQTRHIVIDAILILVMQYYQNGLTPISIRSFVHRYVNFIDWLNAEGIPLPIDLETARGAYMKYSIYLRERLSQGTLKHPTAHQKQVAAIKLLEEIFDDPENSIRAFIEIIPQNIPGNNNSTTVCDEDVEYAFNFYYTFFEQVADFILDEKPYPHTVELLGGNAVILPRKSFLITPLNSNWMQLGKFIDTDSGEILSEKDIITQVRASEDWNNIGTNNQWNRIYRGIKSREKILTAIELANNDIYSDVHRLVLGEKAMKAYFMVLLILTGMNDVGLSLMEWDDEDYCEEKQMQGFRTIKKRAKNKEVIFEIQNEFMPSFKKYLKLRKYILNGYKSSYLFFTGNSNNTKISRAQRDGAFAANIFAGTFKRFNPDLPNVLSKDFRVHKAKWVRKESGLFVGASMLQNSIPTFIKYYDGETREEKEKEVSNFLDTVHDRISKKRKETDTGIVAGTCIDYGIPENIEGSVPIIPDCNQPEGCFFCTKYRLHLDESDIRKLLSLEYIIREISISNARNQEHFNAVMDPILDKIEEYLNALKDCKEGIDEMISKIRIDVFENENLTLYWEHKLVSMYRMGVVK